jgi:transcriptional regulator with GAF, ATPase, and Fis domain
MLTQNSPVNKVFIDSIQSLKNQQLEAFKSLASQLQRQIEFIENIEDDMHRQLNDGEFRLDEAMKRIEIDIICAALINSRGVQKKAAQFLGLNLSTLNAKIKRYQIDVNRF